MSDGKECNASFESVIKDEEIILSENEDTNMKQQSTNNSTSAEGQKVKMVPTLIKMSKSSANINAANLELKIKMLN